jgi:RNA polymerase sigma factor (sigma-70 family)
MKFEEMYEKLAPRLLRYARRLGLSREDAEEVVQEAFLALLKRPVHRPRQYLFAATANGSRSHWRRQSRMLPAPSDVVESHDLSRVIARDLLRRLPRRERVALWLRYAEQCTVREVAVRIGYSVSGTEKLLRRAAALLEEGEESESRRVGRSPERSDKHRCRGRFAAKVMMRSHVCPLRGAAVPRIAARVAVVPAHRRPARKVSRELSRAHGLLSPSLRRA